MKIYRSEKKNFGRILIAFAVLMLLFLALAVRLGYHMLYKADEYSKMAVRQQTSDSQILAVRGGILDRNGSELAISVTAYTVWVRPSSVKSNGKTDSQILENAKQEAQTLSAILSLSYQEVYDQMMSEKTLVRLAKNLPLAKAQELEEAGLRGVEITEAASRSYPLGRFACHVIGLTNDDNEGLSGLELAMNNQLEGINGRWITTKDNKSGSLAVGTNKYYEAQDGYDIVTTIDSNIQYIVEQKLAECQKQTESDRVMCLIMDPATGEILAMAQTPSYDLNDPRAGATEEDAAALEDMSNDEKVAYWNRLWRNFCISDVYEPGSTFKLITTGIALDNAVTYEGETFVCQPVDMANYTLKCWYYPRSHGKETLAQAVGNSCNPVMIALSKRVGITRYYEGLDAFGLTEKTGIGFPGEGSNILQDKELAGPTGLATMSYGQGIAVTPISLVSAISAYANGGYIMQPRLVKEIRGKDGETIETFEPEIKSRPVSAQTAAQVLDIMEYVVEDGGGGNAKVPGYRIGGKTGTASKPENGGYSETDVYSSFIGVAPIDDPRFVILVICDTPKGVLYGSSTAAPCAKEIMAEVFRSMDIQPQYTEAELKEIEKSKVEVPDVKDQSVENAIGILAGKNLDYTLTPEISTTENLVVIDQYPRAGEEMDKYEKVTLYYDIVPAEEEIPGPDTVTEDEYND